MRTIAAVRNPRIIGLLTTPRSRSLVQSRWNHTQPPSPASQEPSPHVGFYKTFARPIAKVLLMATFTYQLVYWAWVKLEKDEIKEGRKEIRELEDQLKALKELKEPAGAKK